MKYIDLMILEVNVLIIISIILGYSIGNKTAVNKMQQEAIENGVGEFIIVHPSGDKKFRYLKPNCGPH
jgi:hypothetical protein